MFCAGANWIPADSFLPRVTKEKYKAWISLALKGHQNMLRVWGGGIYESDTFYDLCDTLGILVWQDFMFACGAYPAYPEFRTSVDREAREVVKRLRGRPCLAIMTGNNEDYAFAETTGIKWDPRCEDPDEWLKSGFPARYIYEITLPAVVKELCGDDVAYKPGSPWSPGGRNSADLLIGDVHQWNVWHGSQEPYQNYKNLAGRFVSEFGMQGFPIAKTVKCFFGGDTQKQKSWHPTSRIIDHHNKATGFLRRIAGYLYENIRFDMKLDNFI